MARSRKISTGPKTSPTTLIGQSGLPYAYGYGGDALGLTYVVTDDPVAELRGQSRARILRQMGENDLTLAGVLFALKTLIRSAEWQVIAADKTIAAKKMAEDVSDMLFKRLERSFMDVIGEACTAFHYGFAPIEFVYRQREDSRYEIRTFKLRSQLRITQWFMDDEETPQGFTIQTDYGAQRDVPLDRCVNVRVEATLDNPEGYSILRPTWRTWKRKEQIENAEGRYALRAAGFPLVRIPGKLFNPQTPEDIEIRASFDLLLADLAKDQKGALLLPSDVDANTKALLYDVSYVIADARRGGDMTPIINRFNQQMAASMLADFILLGGDGTKPSFALSSDKTDMFTKAIMWALRMIGQAFTTQALTRMWELNGYEPALMPKIEARDVADTSIANAAAYLKDLVGANVITPDDKLEEHMREVAQLPVADPTSSREPPAPVAPGQAGGSPGQATSGPKQANGTPAGTPRPKAAE